MPPPARRPKLRRAVGAKSVIESAPKSSGEAWARSTLRKMTLDEKLGQLLMIPYFGGFTSTESSEFQRLEHLVQELIDFLRGLGFGQTESIELVDEDVRFSLPAELVVSIR